MDYTNLYGASWSKLAVAATALVLSYIGFYNNRDEYPVWKARFVNVPFLQYLVSLVILAGYWGLAITAIGPNKTSLRPEAAIIFGVFFLYLIWDVLQLIIQWRVPYCEATKTRVDQDYQYQYGSPPKTTTYYLPGLTSRTKVRLYVSLMFTVMMGVMAICLWITNPTREITVIWIDILYCGVLIIYRIVQELLANAYSSKFEMEPSERTALAQMRDQGRLTQQVFMDRLKKLS